MNKKKCGFISIVGRSNVGKSTLINKVLGQKISITSSKPKTTQHCIMGIHTENNYQAIYVDTPGFCTNKKNDMNRLMNRSANHSLRNVELVIFMIEDTKWITNDEIIMNKLRTLQCKVLILINKVDNLKEKKKLLPYIGFLSNQMKFIKIFPISAKKNIHVDSLKYIVHQLLPLAVHCFPKNYICDRSQFFLASQIIREKIIRFLGKELPYSVQIEIKQFIINDIGNYNIYGLVLVERESQKKIVIGKKGYKIKKMSINARRDMEKIFEAKVYLDLWVKIPNILNYRFFL